MKAYVDIEKKRRYLQTEKKCIQYYSSWNKSMPSKKQRERMIYEQMKK